MDNHWKAIIGLTGLGGVGAFIFWSLYNGWLKLDIFSRLSGDQTFIIMLVFLIIVFIGMSVLVSAYLKTHPTEMNKNSTKSGDIPAPINNYLSRFPQFKQECDLSNQCIRTSQESFYAAIREIFKSLKKATRFFQLIT